MLKSGVNDEEIRAYFERYDTDGNMALTRDEFNKMQESLTKVNQQSKEAAKVIILFKSNHQDFEKNVMKAQFFIQGFILKSCLNSTYLFEFPINFWILRKCSKNP